MKPVITEIELVGGKDDGTILEVQKPKTKKLYNGEWYFNTELLNDQCYLVFRHSLLEQEFIKTTQTDYDEGEPN